MKHVQSTYLNLYRTGIGQIDAVATLKSKSRAIINELEKNVLLVFILKSLCTMSNITSKCNRQYYFIYSLQSILYNITFIYY